MTKNAVKSFDFMKAFLKLQDFFLNYQIYFLYHLKRNKLLQFKGKKRSKNIHFWDGVYRIFGFQYEYAEIIEQRWGLFIYLFIHF